MNEFSAAKDSDTPDLRVALVEDEPRYRASISTLIRHTPGFALAWAYPEAAPVLELVRKARDLGLELPWDMVLTDIGLGGMDGIELTRSLKSLRPALPVVVLSVFEEPATVFAAICAGADGYLLKSAAPGDLVKQLQLIAHGGAPLSATLAGTLMRLVRMSGSNGFAQPVPHDLGLTPRQLQVLRCLVDGNSYREIAHCLDISLDTVRSHIRQIYSALQVNSVAEAVSSALRRGLA
ncbi:MAG: response regulator transcription factor [Rudaea sp.]|uniref:response regulator n=1 Tax=Rudaea sp. TaxID=2136325 RepID=UPI0039E3236C